MEADSLIAVLSIVMIFVGLFSGQVWLAVVFFAILIAALIGGGKKETKPEQVGTLVRPIVVKRKYVGPESIYPKAMKVRVTDTNFGTGKPWHVMAGIKIGEGVGKIMKTIFRKED